LGANQWFKKAANANRSAQLSGIVEGNVMEVTARAGKTVAPLKGFPAEWSSAEGKLQANGPTLR